MKLRIRGNSLRLRLSRREVTELAEQGRVEDAIAFGAGPASRLVYALAVSDEAPAAFAHLEGGRIQVTLPTASAREWTSSDRVGIEAEQPNGDGSVLRILVEKDFECLVTRPGEDDRDAYPNPNRTA